MSKAMTPEAVFDIVLEERGRGASLESIRLADVATFTVRRRV